jgi:hypothetical protein
VDALAGPADPELDRLLGAPRAAELRAALHARAGRWAHEVAPGRAFAAAAVADVPGLLAGHDGPVLLAAPDVPGLDAAAAAAALDDLGHGADVVLGAAHDARPYLVALARPEPELLALVEASFEDVVAALTRRRTALGMLRAERRLRSVADARALALDPLAPRDLVRLLAPPAR